jgi:membrane protein
MTADAEHDAGRDTVLTHGVVSDHPADLLHGTGWRGAWAVLREAGLRLWSDDAFGLAGNIAFRALLAIFPFLIFTSSLTAFIADPSMADALIHFLLSIIPPELAGPIVAEVEQVMTVPRGGVLSLGILLTVWFAVGGVDGVRVGLNRAYGIRETRSTLQLLVVQVAVVIVAGFAMVLVGYLLVFAPRIGTIMHEVVPGFDPAEVTSGLIRYPSAVSILAIALFAAHVILPARPVRLASIWPGVFVTVVLLMLLGLAFSYWLRTFASYTSYYAGLAGIVAALYFLYLTALVLIFGGEFNRALRIRHLGRRLGEAGHHTDGTKTGGL